MTESAKNMKTRPRYISLEEAVPGAVLGAPVCLASGGVLRVNLAAGQTLDADNLRQLARHGAEFIMVAEPDPRTDQQVAEDAASAARRTMEIFEGADLSDPLMAEIFDQILAYRSA
jgi:hypothetical protein